jgi:AraC-like DNA-binding protein
MKHERSPSDVLGEALHFLRMTGTFYCRSELTSPWGLDLPRCEGGMSFHAVSQGSCWLDVEGTRTLIEPGDFVLVPHGEGHRLFDAPGTPAASLSDLPHETVSGRYALLRHGGGGPATSLVCGAVRFEHPAAAYLTRALPMLIHVQGGSTRRMDWLRSTLEFMSDEARELRPGGETVITRLADILVIQAIRSWIEQDPAARTGWLGALQDARIGRSIALIHREPERPWTVAALAGEAAMSRSSFAAHFTELVGESPMRYLARWRMQIAAARLQEPAGQGLGEMAETLGYRSEAAFHRAFKRHLGVSPGRLRRNAAVSS